jgi:hypothetical protein
VLGRGRVGAALGVLASAFAVAGVASATFSASQTAGPLPVATASVEAPGGLTWTDDCNNTGKTKWNNVQLKWGATASSFVTGYEIMRGNGSSGTRQVVGTVSGLATTTWSDATVQPNSPYNYSVRATYAGWESPDSNVVAQTVSGPNCKP